MVDPIWITILAGGVLTFATRLSFIYLLGRWQPPPRLKQALRFVPPAVLSAIIFPQVLMRGDQLYLAVDNLRLWAALVAVAVAWRTRSVLWSIAAGMTSLYLLTWLGQAVFAR